MPPANAGRPVLSIVTPVYNEHENLPELYRRLTTVMQAMADPYELIFVDDGSADDSAEIIIELSRSDRCVKLVQLSRNFGHQRALTAGIAVAAGQAVVTMDSDLQDAPEAIPQFVEKWRQGYKVVYAVRRTRKEGFAKQLAYRTFYRLLDRLSDVSIPLDSGDFGLMDRKVVDLINSLPERTRFLRGLRAWVGYKQIGLPLDRDARFAGQPKYSLRQLLTLASSGVVSFSLMPLRLASALGMVVSTTSFLGIVFVICWRLFTPYSIPGFASTASLILFVGGIQLLTIGVLGEYIGRIFDEVKERPTFIIAEKYGFDDGDGDAGKQV
jgi:dolichol-phosphate mannosyltransferase